MKQKKSTKSFKFLVKSLDKCRFITDDIKNFVEKKSRAGRKVDAAY